MQVIIKNEINYVEEAQAFLFYYVNADSYERLRTDYLKKGAADVQRFERIAQTIEKIRNYVADHMRLDKSKLEFYFKKLGGNNVTLSYFLLPLFPDISRFTFEDYEYAAKNNNSTQVLQDFEYILSQEYVMGGKPKEERKINSFEDITRLIDQDDSLSTEDRWKIVQAYLKHDQLLEEVCGIFKRIIQLLRECHSDIEELEQEFYNYWTEYGKKQDILKDLQKISGFTWEYNEEGTYLIPSLFFHNSIIYSINDKEDKKPDLLHLGLLIDSNLSIKPAAIDSNDMNNCLKLLSDKSKFDILMYIKDKPAYGFEIANALNLSTSTISYHMSALVNSQMVKLEKDANKVYYSIEKERITRLLEDIKSMLLS